MERAFAAEPAAGLAGRHGLSTAGSFSGCRGAGRAVTLARVRLTEFWARMRQQFGDVYADSVAADHVLSDLGSRTVNQALADGVEVKRIWLAVCEAFRVPERQR